MKEMQSLIKKIIVRLAMLPLVLFLLVIVPAGTFNFWEAYVYFGILLIPMIYILFFFLRNDPVFLERRTRLKEKEKEQKIILVVFNLVFIAGFVIPGLDKRFGWSDVPTGIVLITDLIIFLGYMLMFAVFRQNLEGYIEYCQRTRYRLIPFLW